MAQNKIQSSQIGNITVTNLNSGTNASASTVWAGDGTWATPPADQAQHGVLSRTTVAPLPTTLTTTTFTLSCGTTPMTYYNNGRMVVKNTNQTCTIGAGANLYFIYFNSSDVLTASTTFPGLTAATGNVFIATVTWNGSNFGAINDERHGNYRNTSWHVWAHATIGARYGAGLTFTFTGTTNANTTFAVSSGNIYDEDIDFTVTAQTTGRIWRQTAAGVYSLVTNSSTLPYLYSAGAQAVRSDTFALVTITSANQYFNYFVYATTDVERPIQIVVETVSPANIGGYNSAATARLQPVPALGNGVALSQEWKLLYRVVVNGVGLVQTITTADDYRSSSTLPGGGVASSTASSVSYTPTTPDTSVTVQGALDVRPIQALVPVGGTTGQVLSKSSATDYALTWTTVSSGSASPAGSNTQIQYNNSGAFGGSSNFTWNNGTSTLTIAGLTAAISSSYTTFTAPNAPTTSSDGNTIRLYASGSGPTVGGGGGIELYAAPGSGGSPNGNITLTTTAGVGLQIIGDGGAWVVGGTTGTTGQVLQSTGTSTPPAWASPSAGESGIVNFGGVSSVTVTSTTVLSTSRIFTSIMTNTFGAYGSFWITNIVDNTSFDINFSGVLGTSFVGDVSWIVVN